MRSQQLSASKVNPLCSGIGASCTGSDSSSAVNFQHQMKSKPHFSKRRESSVTRTMNQAASSRTNVYVFHRMASNKHNDDCYADKSVIAQPLFVFKKKERPCKRPAEDPVYKTENVLIGCSRKRARSSSFSFQTSDSQSYREAILSQKRVRSSSFTIIPTFPPSQPVKKNNIFMTSALLQKSTDVKATEKGILSTNVHRDVLRPATLQPPQTPVCSQVNQMGVEHVLEDRHKANAEAFEDVCSRTDSSEKPSLALPFSCAKAVGSNQLPEDRTFSDSGHSGFVFGENIIERVWRPEKSPELYSESKPHTEQDSTFAGDFQTSFPSTTPVSAKNATLIESATAYTSNKLAQRCLLDKVEVTTGEEAEHNVLQINCRLFLFNKASLSWIERGSGCLRLNDTSSNQCGMLQSRLVIRNQGSMKLILNTRLWTQMVIERANRKSLCITATDLEDCSVKVFLIQASSKDTGSLYAAIHHRLVALRSFAEQECDANQVMTDTDIQPPNCDSDDDENEKITRVKHKESAHSPWIRRQPVICS